MLYLIGLGLGDQEDITVKGLAAIKACTKIYLEAYTSVLPGVDKTTLVRTNSIDTIYLISYDVGGRVWKGDYCG